MYAKGHIDQSISHEDDVISLVFFFFFNALPRGYRE